MVKKIYSDFDDTMIEPGSALYTSYKYSFKKEKTKVRLAKNTNLNKTWIQKLRDCSVIIVSLNQPVLIQEVILNNQEALTVNNIQIENIHGNFKNRQEKQKFLEKEMDEDDIYIGDFFEKELNIHSKPIIVIQNYSKIELYMLYVKKVSKLCQNLFISLFL